MQPLNNKNPQFGIPLWIHMAIIMGVITALLCFGLGLFVKIKASKTVTAERKVTVEGLSSMFGELLMDDVIVRNKNGLYEKVLQISKIHPDLMAISISDRDGLVLVDWHRDGGENHRVMNNDQPLLVSGEIFGKIASRWNMEDTFQEIERRWKTVVLIVFGFCFVLAVHLLLAMKFTLFKPLKKVEQRLASFSDGNVEGFLPRSHWTSREFNNIESVADLLEQEIKARMAAEKRLQVARIQANEANQAKSLFLTNMSHELRTPLNAILGYSELLQELANEKGEMEFVDDLQKIHKSGDHLLQLINGVLDLSKIEAGKIVLSNSLADTCDIASELVETIQPMAKASNSRIVCNFEKNVQPYNIDTLRFRQILFNLLSNAAKFTKNGLIELSIQVGKNDDKDYVIYRVRDTGIGIAEDKLTRIFDDFVQASADTSHHYGGTGLGLTISKKLSRLMGGDISVTSTLGQGSTFILKLPNISNDKAQQKSA